MARTQTVTITVISTTVSNKKHFVRGWGKGLGEKLIIDGYTESLDEARECFDEEDAQRTINRFVNAHGREFKVETFTVPVSKRHQL
jgi:hypothetical protein